jgi:dipeptidyl aminopeptidase/acylaminoacyl peptidase
LLCGEESDKTNKNSKQVEEKMFISPSLKPGRKALLAFCVLSTALTALGCGAPQPVVEQAPKKSVPEVDAELIPRSVLFGNPDKAAARVSPDGTRLSFLAPVNGVLNVWVGPIDDPSKAKPVTDDKKRGIRIYFWAFTNKHIIYLQDKDGDENWHVNVVDLEKGESKDVTPFDAVRAEISGVSHLFPNEILVSLNNRVPELHDVHRLNLETGALTLVQQNPGFVGFLIDDNYKVRFGIMSTPEGGMAVMKPKEKVVQVEEKVKKKDKKDKKKKKKAAEEEVKTAEEEAKPAEENPLADWESFMQIGMEDALTTSPVGFNKEGDVLYLMDSRGRNTGAAATLDLKTNELKIVFEDPKADVSDLMIHPTEKTLEAVASTYERKEWKVLDDSIKEDFDVLTKVADGDFEVTSRSLDDKQWIVVYIIDDGPYRYYRYDRAAKKAHFLFTNRSDLENQTLVKMHPVVVKSRDGLNLVNYFSLPPGSDPDGDERPSEPLPLLVDVHGGPWARVSWDYDPTHQWFTNRGYAVMSVNYRGSTGFGKDFINAGNLEWAGKMHDDVIDSVEWAVKEGIADPERVAIFGGSYGGYATLVGLTFTPEEFACGVDICGPSNLVTLLNTIPPYWAPMIELFTKRVGDHRTEAGRALLNERSPLTHADKITKPLLIGQGANDPRVKQAEADQIVQAMEAKNIPVTYILYPDEGHGFARPENRLSFFAVADAFLSECLGGRFEPVGEDFKGSSISAPAGVEHVPGLADALAAPH